jgi:hypothetical protein
MLKNSSTYIAVEKGKNEQQKNIYASFTFSFYTAFHSHRELLFAMTTRTCPALQDGFPFSHPPTRPGHMHNSFSKLCLILAWSFGIALGDLSTDSVVLHSKLETVTHLASDNSIEECGCHIPHRRLSQCYYLPPQKYAGASS